MAEDIEVLLGSELGAELHEGLLVIVGVVVDEAVHGPFNTALNVSERYRYQEDKYTKSEYAAFLFGPAPG